MYIHMQNFKVGQQTSYLRHDHGEPQLAINIQQHTHSKQVIKPVSNWCPPGNMCKNLMLSKFLDCQFHKGVIQDF